MSINGFSIPESSIKDLRFLNKFHHFNVRIQILKKKKYWRTQFPNSIRLQSIVHISTDRCDKLFNENRFPIVCPICVTFLNWVGYVL